MPAHKMRQLISRGTGAFGFLLGFAAASISRGAVEDELRAVRLLELAVIAQWKATPSSATAASEAARIDAAYRSLLKKYPADAGIRNAYASFLWSTDRQAEATVEWEHAARLDPANGEIAYHLGGCRLAQGRIKEANEYFEVAVKADPKNALYHYNLATSWYLFRHQISGEGEAAAFLSRVLEHFRAAVALAPFNVEFARGYAETFYGIPEPNWLEALEAWRHFATITNDKSFAFSHLARVSLRLGAHSDARHYLSKMTDPRFIRLRANLSRQIDAAEAKSLEKERRQPLLKIPEEAIDEAGGKP
jgi:tetratricopeptide (TPR) repeat protein